MPERVDSQEMSSIDEKPLAEDNAGQFQDRFRFMTRYVTWEPQRLVPTCMLAFVVATFVTCGFATGCSGNIADGAWWAVILLVVFLCCTLAPFLIILILQQSTSPLRYKVYFDNKQNIVSGFFFWFFLYTKKITCTCISRSLYCWHYMSTLD